MRIDLHMHSTASDGVYAPVEVVRMALERSIDVIALTDHDNLAGIRPAQQAAAGTSLTVLAGVELSSEDPKRETHILGYLMDVDCAPFLAHLSEMREARSGRADRIVEKLNTLGMAVSIDRVRQIAGTGAIGRPHIAQAMVEGGYVGGLQEAFDRYIDNNGPAYVPRYQLAPETAIAWIHEAGGVAVMAHPGHYADYEPTIRLLAPAGLDGIEVYYPDQGPALVQHLLVLARELDLIATGGSDFHRRDGDGSARLGSVNVPAEVPAQLQARATRWASAHRSG
jgi:predicted metal-dependent phosphoesterase TrpH